MARGDILITTNVSANLRAGTQSAHLVKVGSTIYAFYIESGAVDLYFVKSTDGGITWSNPTSIKAATVAQVSVWFDQWTPGDTGTKIHLAYAETDADDVFYRSLDTNGDSLGTETTIFAGASGLSNNASTCLAITKARGGNLLCMGDIDGGTETFFARSVDVGANWTSRSNSAEGGDYFLLAPGFAADNQDIMCIFWDASAGEVSRKNYDDSADSWAETSISINMQRIASTTCAPQFALTVDATNSRLVVIGWNNRDAVNADLKVWWVTDSSITAKTDVVTDSVDDQQLCAVALATDTRTLFAFYGGKSDGSETAGTSINIYYKTSDDLGVTWGLETVLTLSARNFDMLYTFLTFTGDFGCEFLATIADPAARFLYYSALLPHKQEMLTWSQATPRSNI